MSIKESHPIVYLLTLKGSKLEGEMDFKFKHPCNIIIAGSTSSGKTYLTRDLLAHHQELFTIKKSIVKVLWCYIHYQPIYEEKIANTQIIYHEGIPELEYIKDVSPQIIVFDDLMLEGSQSRELVNFFTRGGHHMGITIIYVVQNIFFNGKNMRTITLNTHYMILLKSVRDHSQVLCLGRQMMPKNSQSFYKAYIDATKKPYSNFIIDFHPTTDEQNRLRSWINIKGGEKGFVVYKIK